MPSKPTPAALSKVLKLVDASNYDRIELALALANREEAKPGTVAGLAKIRPKQRRRLYYLLEVGNWLKPIKQPKERIARIGWTKLAILAQLCGNELGKTAPRQGLILAEKYTAKELPALLKGAGLPKKGEKTLRRLLFHLRPTEYEVFATILIAHGAKPSPGKGKGLGDKEAALMAFVAKAQEAGVGKQDAGTSG